MGGTSARAGRLADDEVGEAFLPSRGFSLESGGGDDAIWFMAAEPRGTRLRAGAKNRFKLPCLAAAVDLIELSVGSIDKDAFSFGRAGELERRADLPSKTGGEDGGGVIISEDGPGGEEHDKSIEYEDELDDVCCKGWRARPYVVGILLCTRYDWKAQSTMQLHAR